MSLTIVAINHAKPKDKTYRLYDEKGLYLEVTKAGGKLWRLKYRFGGKEKRLAIGPCYQGSRVRYRSGSHQAFSAQICRWSPPWAAEDQLWEAIATAMAKRVDETNALSHRIAQI